MPKPPNEEEKKIKDFLQTLGFNCSAVTPEIMKNFKYTQSPVEWISIGVYCLTNRVLKEIKEQGRELITPSEFISDIARMKKIDNVKICLFQLNNKWCSLIAVENIQRSISAILSGDGYGPKCEFGIRPLIQM